MTLKGTTHHIILNEEELKIWMTALRLAARSTAKDVIDPLQSPYYLQHDELVRRTGLCEVLHGELWKDLKGTKK